MQCSWALVALLLISSEALEHGQSSRAGTAVAPAEASHPVGRTAETYATPEVTTQEGIATDGEYLFVSGIKQIHKYRLHSGTHVSSSVPVKTHIGGMDFHDGKLYVAQSACPSSGTSPDHHILEYDRDLIQIGEHDIGSDFSICAGAVAWHDGEFLVAESYYDNDHPDRIVRYDGSFRKVGTIVLPHTCAFGIQGLKYISSEDGFRINCHDTEWYSIDARFNPATIRSHRASFKLQDLVERPSGALLYNDRAGHSVHGLGE